MENETKHAYDVYAEGPAYANHYRVQQQELFRFIEQMREKSDCTRTPMFSTGRTQELNFL